MAISATSTALAFWRMAQSAPFGIGLRTSDPAAAKRQLYNARAGSGDPSLNTIQVRTSPVLPSTDVWLVRDRAAEARQAEEDAALDADDLDPVALAAGASA